MWVSTIQALIEQKVEEILIYPFFPAMKQVHFISSWAWTELNHLLSWVSSLQTVNCGTFQPPSLFEPILHNLFFSVSQFLSNNAYTYTYSYIYLYLPIIYHLSINRLFIYLNFYWFCFFEELSLPLIIFSLKLLS